jgi:hypothetical protein
MSHLAQFVCGLAVSLRLSECKISILLERRWPRVLRHTSSKLFATLHIDVNVDGKSATALPHLLEVMRSN